MARFGYLFLHQGNWNGKQVVPASWVKESTASYSAAGEGQGYGYLWWVDGFNLPVKSFSARGVLAKYIVVIPERDIVVVYQSHVDLPDDAQSMSDEDMQKLPTISLPQMSTLLKLLLDAQQK
jgi:CubicO group peptidase (beta-lactamase class C family)